MVIQAELKISTISGKDALPRLEALRTPLELLARNSCTPNVFYEPFMLFPALELFGSASLRFLIIHRGPTDEPTPESEILGFFPLQEKPIFGGLFRGLELWHYVHCYLCNPLVRVGAVGPVMKLFVAWLQGKNCGAQLMRWSHVDLDRPEVQTLVGLGRAQMLPAIQDYSYTRAVVIPSTSAETYMDHGMSTRKRSKLKRSLRLLQQEKGKVEFVRFESPEDADRCFNTFADIEHLSYKRQLGTSVRSSKKDEQFFSKIIHDGSLQGQTVCHGLFVDGKPVSYRVSVESGGHLFLLKISFDPKFARYSPGTLLEKHVLHELHGELGVPRSVTLHDSCCYPEDEYLSHIWSEKRRIGRQYIAAGRLVGAIATILLSLKYALKALRRTRVTQTIL